MQGTGEEEGEKGSGWRGPCVPILNRCHVKWRVDTVIAWSARNDMRETGSVSFRQFHSSQIYFLLLNPSAYVGEYGSPKESIITAGRCLNLPRHVNNTFNTDVKCCRLSVSYLQFLRWLSNPSNMLLFRRCDVTALKRIRRNN